MKVGDYVRTKKGVIGKYNIVKTGETIPNWNGGYGYKEVEKEYIDNNIYNRFDDVIIKSSQNIIDLIEVGDFIGKTIVEEVKEFDDGTRVIVMADGFDEYDENEYFLKAGIVTKEQFSQMEYRIGE